MKIRIALALILFAAAMPIAHADQPFSRSRWIAEQMALTPFSGGVVPNDHLLPVPVGVARQGSIGQLVRVSTDLLPPAGGSQLETQAEPYIAVNPNDPSNLLAAWQESRFADGGARALGYAVSYDGGATWDEGLLPQITTAVGGRFDRASDPWVAFGPDNRAYFASLVFNENNPDNGVFVSSSENGGRTWGSPVKVFGTDDFSDKQSVTVDASPTSPFSGTIYAAWDINFAGSPNQRLVVARSTDGGVTWKKPVKIRAKNNNLGIIPRTGSDGTVYAVWAGRTANSGFKVFFSRSTDGGAHWSKPRKLESITPAGIGGFRTGEGLPSFDIDRQTGALYVAWADRRWSGVDQVTFIASHDGGETWSDARRVNDGPADAPLFTVGVAAGGDGTVAISYYSLRNDPELGFHVDTYVQRSLDGGETFMPGERLTPDGFDIRHAAQARGYFLGDYMGLAGSSSGFHVAFVAPLLPSAADPVRLQPDVFAARTP